MAMHSLHGHPILIYCQEEITQMITRTVFALQAFHYCCASCFSMRWSGMNQMAATST
jgi:hypothetical protein